MDEIGFLRGVAARVKREAIALLRREVAVWNAGRASRETIESLFSLDAGYPQMSSHWKLIEGLCASKLVRVRIWKLPDAPVEDARRLEGLLRRSRYYRSADHQGADKVRALYWLQTRGSVRLAAEGEYEAGRYDVAARDLGVVVECGTVRADKLLRAFLSSRLTEFAVVPLGIHRAIAFNFDTPTIRRVRDGARRSRDPLAFLSAILRERTFSKDAIRRSLQEAESVFWDANLTSKLGL